MTKLYPLSHIKIAQNIWKSILSKDSTVVDATCGNGHDSLFLAEILQKGNLYCIDIQQDAIIATKNLLDNTSCNTTFIQDCHSKIETHIPSPVDLIVYNLGYLPGSDKSLTTMTKTTLTSLKKSLTLIKPKGLVSITCYPGHSEGNLEQSEIETYLQDLDLNNYNIYSYKSFYNKAPTLFLIKKIN